MYWYVLVCTGRKAFQRPAAEAGSEKSRKKRVQSEEAAVNESLLTRTTARRGKGATS